ncbi:hypothetical protein [Halapricum desulfuricans]|uniref:Putative membrane protein n=1 Tax=Halapricum desulfuricans TaxID=2841257 RepID=A0A897NPV7_9EURY|nr:hypothetical protein [Halapricum desulfuricans]QSG08007.1 putative membrane protein [Halapricum desulfuricans]QSG12869.1 putative membrane protein [Halapricum desulfuricans]
MDREQLIELVPHYVAMLILAFLTLAVVSVAVGEIGFWIEVALIVVVVFGYRLVVVRLGVGPSVWESP